MIKITKLVVASHNQGKINEIKNLLKQLNIEVISSAELNIRDIEETGTTFAENAKIKAEATSLMCGLPCLADDSGLCVDALDGRPGVYSARYAPDRNFKLGIQKLLSEIEQTKSNNRNAHFSCCLAFARPKEKTIFFEGRVDGKISSQPQGDNGFGYDPIFIPDGFNQTFAELGNDIKNTMSHRSRALEKFIKELS